MRSICNTCEARLWTTRWSRRFRFCELGTRSLEESRHCMDRKILCHHWERTLCWPNWYLVRRARSTTTRTTPRSPGPTSRVPHQVRTNNQTWCRYKMRFEFPTFECPEIHLSVYHLFGCRIIGEDKPHKKVSKTTYHSLWSRPWEIVWCPNFPKNWIRETWCPALTMNRETQKPL